MACLGDVLYHVAQQIAQSYLTMPADSVLPVRSSLALRPVDFFVRDLRYAQEQRLVGAPLTTGETWRVDRLTSNFSC